MHYVFCHFYLLRDVEIFSTLRSWLTLSVVDCVSSFVQEIFL